MDTNDRELLGRLIAEAREAQGMTQADLAARLGKGGKVRTIQDWEAGRRRPIPRTRIRLFEVLKIEGDEELTRSEWPREVRDLTYTLGDLMASLPADDLRRWRHQFIATIVQHHPPRSGPKDWPIDVEVIIDIIGATLVRED
jgi:transcriptional regulator with XRE-family HTH domain